MDRHVRWLRRRLLTFACRRLIFEGAMIAVVFLVVGLALELPVGLVPPWAGLAAQIWVVGRVVTTLESSPLNRSYLERFSEQHQRFDAVAYSQTRLPDSDNEDPDPVMAHRADGAATLPGLGLHPIATLVDSGPDGVQLDVYQPENRMVTAIVCATTLFVTRLDDGRMLVTSSLLVPPHERLMVNLWPGVDTETLAARHVQAVHRVRRAGRSSVPAGLELAATTLAIEQKAYAGLGPFLGPLLSLDGRSRPHLLQTTVEPADLVSLACPGDGNQHQSASPINGSNMASTPARPVPAHVS